LGDFILSESVFTHPQMTLTPLAELKQMEPKVISKTTGVSEEKAIEAVKMADILSNLKAANLDIPALAGSRFKEVAKSASISEKDARVVVGNAAVLNKVNQAGFSKPDLANTATEEIASRSGISVLEAEGLRRAFGIKR
jgi:hypothetical protein